MRAFIFRSALFFVSICVPLKGWCQILCADDRGEADAIRVVRQQFHPDFPLQAARVPELTDDLIFLTAGADPPNAEVPIICFYRVQIASYEQKGNGVVGETVEVDNGSEWLVAFDRHNGLELLLKGAVDPFVEFNKLAKDLHLQVADGNKALSVFDSFLKVACGERVRSQVVGDEMKLESLALEDFRLRLPTNKRRAAFDAWWRRLTLKAKHALHSPKAMPITDGYEIQFFFYRQGNLSSDSLTIRTDGTVAEWKSKVLVSGFPNARMPKHGPPQ